MTIHPTYLPSIYPTTTKPSITPTIAPSISTTLKTSSPSKSPSNYPTKPPTMTPLKINLDDVVQTSMQIIIINDQSISISLIFDHSFDLIDNHKIEAVLEDITNTYITTDCGDTDKDKYNALVTQSGSDKPQTIINATLSTCDTTYNSQLLQAVNDLSFQQQLAETIQDETNLQIVINDDITIIDLYNIQSSLSTTNIIDTPSDTNANSEVEFVEEVRMEILTWMIQVMSIQLAICCFLMVCIALIRKNTKKMKKKKQSIENQIASKRRIEAVHSLRQVMTDDHANGNMNINHYPDPNMSINKYMNMNMNINKHNNNQKYNINQREHNSEYACSKVEGHAHKSDDWGVVMARPFPAAAPYPNQQHQIYVVPSKPTQLKFNNSAGISGFIMPKLLKNSM